MKNMLACTSLLLLSLNVKAQANSTEKHNTMNMKMNAGIVTAKLKETKEFYQNILNFGITFENEFYVLMHTPDHSAQISFLLPNHPSQKPIFQKAYEGKGMYLTIEVDDADSEYERIKKTWGKNRSGNKR